MPSPIEARDEERNDDPATPRLGTFAASTAGTFNESTSLSWAATQRSDTNSSFDASHESEGAESSLSDAGDDSSAEGETESQWSEESTSCDSGSTLVADDPPSTWRTEANTAVSDAAAMATLFRTLDRLEVASALTEAVGHLEKYEIDEAERRVRVALEVAERKNLPAGVSQCYFWLGRIEFHRGNFELAYMFFFEGRPYMHEYGEGRNISGFLDLCMRAMEHAESSLRPPPLSIREKSNSSASGASGGTAHDG